MKNLMDIINENEGRQFTFIPRDGGGFVAKVKIGKTTKEYLLKGEMGDPHALVSSCTEFTGKKGHHFLSSTAYVNSIHMARTTPEENSF